MRFLVLALASAVFQASAIVADDFGNCTSCRCMPGDCCWPSTLEWDALNVTVGGRLVATHPLGAPCHAPTYNATECAILQSEWNNPQLQ
jgi:hypothetical protein